MIMISNLITFILVLLLVLVLIIKVKQKLALFYLCYHTVLELINDYHHQHDNINYYYILLFIMIYYCKNKYQFITSVEVGLSQQLKSL